MIQKLRSMWWALIAIIPPQIMIFMDQTILPVALPTIQKEFSASPVSLEWSVNIYLLFTTIFALPGGKLGDLFGHRFILLLGMVLFTVSSLLCGMSQNIQMLICARALQGIGAAFMIPVLVALMAEVFPKHQRGRAVGLTSSSASFFIVLGPLVGGYLTQEVSWRWIFWINWPIALFGFIACLVLIPRGIPKEGKIDFLGFGYLSLFVVGITVFFTQGRIWHWVSLKTLSMAILAVISIFLLLKREKKSRHPFLDLLLFRYSMFTAVNISIALTTFILMINIFRAIYYQTVLGYSPSMTGVITFFSSLPFLCFSTIGGLLSDRFGPRLPLSIGYLLTIISFFWLGFFPTPSTISLWMALFAFGMGLPLIFTPSYSLAMKSLPANKFGVGFGMVTTLRMLSGTLGVALIGLFMDTVQTYYLRFDSLRESRIASFSAIHFALGILMIVSFTLTLIFYHRKSAHKLPDMPAEGWD